MTNPFKTLSRFFWQRKKILIVVIAAIILTTLGIRASDRVLEFTASISGRGSDSDGPCPKEMVFVTSPQGGFCIDKYEASANSDCVYADPDNQFETRANLENSKCQAVPIKGATPWRHISQDQAALACARGNKRLPTNQEWFQAALGTPDPSSGWTQNDCQLANNWTTQPGLTGSGTNCVSAAGVYDMVGNVWEWVSGAAVDGTWQGQQLPEEGFVDSTDGQSLPGLTNPNTPNSNYNYDYFWLNKEGLRGFLRGGYWGNESDAGVYSVYLVAPPSQPGVAIGFRCAK